MAIRTTENSSCDRVLSILSCPPWELQFGIKTAALWEQYKPKHEYDEPQVFMQELKKTHRKFTVRYTDPGDKKGRRKFTTDERRF